MKIRTVMKITTAALSLLVLLSACTGPAAVASAPAGNKTAAAATEAPATAAPAKTDSPAQAASPCPAFKYYNTIKIGMTKAEVDSATGLAAKEAKGEYDPKGAYYYMDSEGYGVYVIFNGSGKLYNKTVQYKDVAKDLAPLTGKPVTEAQCDKIEKGMTRDEVVQLLGCDGVECSATAVKMDTCEDVGPILRWGNADGSFIQVVVLPDGKVGNAMYFNHG